MSSEDLDNLIDLEHIKALRKSKDLSKGEDLATLVQGLRMEFRKLIRPQVESVLVAKGVPTMHQTHLLISMERLYIEEMLRHQP